MNRLSEGGEAWLASLEVNRPYRWHRGIALATLTAAVFAGTAFAAGNLAGNGPGPAANGPGPGCNIHSSRGFDRNQSRHFRIPPGRLAHGSGTRRTRSVAALG